MMTALRKTRRWYFALIALALVLTVCIESHYLTLRGESYGALLKPGWLADMASLWIVLSAIFSLLFFFAGKVRKHHRIFTRKVILIGIILSILFSVFLDYIDEHVGFEGKFLSVGDVIGLLMYSTGFFMAYSVIVYMIREKNATR